MSHYNNRAAGEQPIFSNPFVALRQGQQQQQQPRGEDDGEVANREERRRKKQRRPKQEEHQGLCDVGEHLQRQYSSVVVQPRTSDAPPTTQQSYKEQIKSSDSVGAGSFPSADMERIIGKREIFAKFHDLWYNNDTIEYKFLAAEFDRCRYRFAVMSGILGGVYGFIIIISLARRGAMLVALPLGYILAGVALLCLVAEVIFTRYLESLLRSINDLKEQAKRNAVKKTMMMQNEGHQRDQQMEQDVMSDVVSDFSAAQQNSGNATAAVQVETERQNRITMFRAAENSYIRALRIREGVVTFILSLMCITIPMQVHDLQSSCSWMGPSADDREENTKCGNELAFRWFGAAITPLLVGQPRFVFVWFGEIVYFVITVYTLQFHNASTAGALLIYLAMFLFCTFVVLVKKVDENTWRSRFELRYVFDKEVVEVRTQSKALQSFLFKITPIHLHNRLQAPAPTGGIQADISSHALCIVVQVKNAVEIIRNMLPTESSRELCEYNHRVKASCYRYGCHHISSIGDVNFFVSNLFAKDHDTMSNAVIQALRFCFRKCFTSLSFEVAAGIGTGPLVGMPLGLSFIRYDIFGEALHDAQRLLQMASPGEAVVPVDACEGVTDDLVINSRCVIDIAARPSIDMPSRGDQPHAVFQNSTGSQSSQDSASGSSPGKLRQASVRFGELAGEAATSSLGLNSSGTTMPYQGGQSDTASVKEYSQTSSERNQPDSSFVSTSDTSTAIFPLSTSAMDAKRRLTGLKVSSLVGTHSTAASSRKPFASIDESEASSINAPSQVLPMSTQEVDVEHTTNISTGIATTSTITVNTGSGNSLTGGPQQYVKDAQMHTHIVRSKRQKSSETMLLPERLRMRNRHCYITEFVCEEMDQECVAYFDKERLRILIYISFFNVLYLLTLLAIGVENRWSAFDWNMMVFLFSTLCSALVFVGVTIGLRRQRIRRTSTRKLELVFVCVGIIAMIGCHFSRPSPAGDSNSFFVTFSFGIKQIRLEPEYHIILLFTCGFLQLAATFFITPMVTVPRLLPILFISGFLSLATVLKHRYERQIFAALKRTEQLLRTIRQHHTTRETIQNAIIPPSVKHRMLREVVIHDRVDCWSCNECVVLNFSTTPADMGQSMMQYVHPEMIRDFAEETIGRIEDAISNCTNKSFNTIRVFGGTVVVAGPLDSGGSVAALVQCAEDIVEIMTTLMRLGTLKFTAGVALGLVVNVMKLGEFPSYDLMGPAVTRARDITLAAPAENAWISENLVNLIGMECKLPPGMRFSALESWRLRDTGTVRVAALLQETPL